MAEVVLQAPDGQRGTLIGPAERIAEVVRPEAVVHDARWWHAWGRVMGEDGYLPGCWSMVLIGPASKGPEAAAELAASDWGEYLASWDHYPSDAEKDAVTPAEYRDDEEG